MKRVLFVFFKITYYYYCGMNNKTHSTLTAHILWSQFMTGNMFRGIFLTSPLNSKRERFLVKVGWSFWQLCCCNLFHQTIKLSVKIQVGLSCKKHIMRLIWVRSLIIAAWSWWLLLVSVLYYRCCVDYIL